MMKTRQETCLSLKDHRIPLQKGKTPDELAKELDRKLKADPKSAELLAQKGAMLFLIGEGRRKDGCGNGAGKAYAEAEFLLGRALAMDPSQAETWRRLGLVQYAQYWASGDREKLGDAAEKFDKAIERDKKLAVAWSNKAEALMHLGDAASEMSTAAAVLHFAGHLEEDKSSQHSEEMMHLYREARHAIETALFLAPDDASAQLCAGNVLYRLFKEKREPSLFKSAVEHCDKAISLRKGFAEALLFKGCSIMDAANYGEQKGENVRGMYKEALELISKALELDEAYPTAWVRLWVLYQKFGDDDKAQRAFRKAMEMGLQ